MNRCARHVDTTRLRGPVGQLCVALLLGVGVVCTPATATAASQSTMPRTVAVSLRTPARILLGQHLTATGAVRTAFSRPVRLQRQTPSRWVTVGSGTTVSSGRYRLRDHTASRVGRYRVMAPAVRHDGHRYTAITSVSRPVAIYHGLHAGQALTGNRGITSPDGAYRLIQQADGNLVEYQGPKAVWASRTNGADRWTTMQADGNLVVYTGPSGGAKALWASGTSGADGARLSLQNDGNAVIYSAGQVALWSTKGGRTGASQNSLNSAGSADALHAGQSLISANGSYRAAMQSDGNFVVYDASGKAIWSSGTAGISGAYLVTQNDGNVVLYSSAGTAKWSSSTAPASHTVLTMQNDGNLVLYSRGGLPLWASRGGRTGYAQDTVPAGAGLSAGQAIYSQNGTYFAVMQGDGNFVKYNASTGAAQWSSGTNGSGANRVVMQGDGNLVVYAGGSAKWASGTSGSGARVVIQNDGNLVVYTGSTARWDSNDNGAPGASGAAAGLGAFKAWALNPANWNSTTDAGRPGIDVDHEFNAQCADLGIAWSRQAGHPSGFDGDDTSTSSKSGWHYAGATFATAKPGDVITRAGNITHVVVVLAAPSGGRVQVLQQNPGSPAVAYYSTATAGVIWRMN